MGGYNLTFRSDTTFHNLALEYAIWKVQDNQIGLKLNRTQQLLVYADDVNLVTDNIDTIQENTETLTVTSKGVGWSRSKRRENKVLSSRHQNAG
jgi:hypothetical protein